MPDEAPCQSGPIHPRTAWTAKRASSGAGHLACSFCLAAAVAALSWQQLKDLPYRLWAIPAGLFVLSVLFAAYAFGRKREVSELKQILKGFQNRAGVAPSEEQLDQLGQMILRSQRNFKELIDSLDDVALAISLDGTLRTVNRRVAEILGRSLLRNWWATNSRIFWRRHRGPREPYVWRGFWRNDTGREWSRSSSRTIRAPLLRLRGQCHRQGRRCGRRQRAGPRHYRAARKGDSASPNSSNACRKASTSALPMASCSK